MRICSILQLTGPSLPGCFKEIPPLDTADAMLPLVSMTTAPTVSCMTPSSFSSPVNSSLLSSLYKNFYKYQQANCQPSLHPCRQLVFFLRFIIFNANLNCIHNSYNFIFLATSFYSSFSFTSLLSFLFFYLITQLPFILPHYSASFSC